MTVHDTNKLPNDSDNLELLEETLPCPIMMHVQSNKRGVACRARAVIRNSSGSSRGVGKVISMTEDVVSLFQQEQDDDDNEKTSCLIDIGRAQDEDTSLANDIKRNASVIADPTEQQLHWHSNQQQSTRQAMQQMGERRREGGPQEQREKGRNDEGGRGQKGKRKEKERETEVKKDVTDWTVVTRNRRQRKMVQIFVRVNGSKATPMEVNLTDDKVEDVMMRIQNDEDAYVTMHGRVLKRSEKLKSCGVSNGCTIQVASRLRGGGKQKGQEEQR